MITLVGALAAISFLACLIIFYIRSAGQQEGEPEAQKICGNNWDTGE